MLKVKFLKIKTKLIQYINVEVKVVIMLILKDFMSSSRQPLMTSEKKRKNQIVDDNFVIFYNCVTKKTNQ